MNESIETLSTYVDKDIKVDNIDIDGGYEYSNPIDLVFMLQTAGNSLDYFNRQKNLIIDYCEYIFKDYSNVNVYIITYGKSSSSIVSSSSGYKYFNNISSIESELNYINYTTNVYDYCDIDKSLELILKNIEFRKDSDIFIYQLINGYTTLNSGNNLSQIITKVKNNIFTAYSLISYPNWKFDSTYNQYQLAIGIANNNDLHTVFSSNTSESIKKHFNKKVSTSNPVYTIVTPTSFKKISLNDIVSFKSEVDTDKDGLMDWEEIDRDALTLDNDNKIYILPTLHKYCSSNNIEIHDFLKGTKYESRAQNLSNTTVLPVLSDPTMIDTDGDGLNDNKDIEPLVDYNSKYDYNYIITTAYKDNYTNNKIDEYEAIANSCYNSNTFHHFPRN